MCQGKSLNGQSSPDGPSSSGTFHSTRSVFNTDDVPTFGDTTPTHSMQKHESCELVWYKDRNIITRLVLLSKGGFERPATLGLLGLVCPLSGPIDGHVPFLAPASPLLRSPLGVHEAQRSIHRP